MSRCSAPDRACVPRRNQAQHRSNEIRMKRIQQIQADHRVAADVGSRTLQTTPAQFDFRVSAPGFRENSGKPVNKW